MSTAIVWFTTDLRIHDNETLVKAIEQNDEIIPVYCLDDLHYTTTNFGFKKTGNFRANFILESLVDLDSNLRILGSGLILLRGRPEIEISKVAQKYNAHKVYCKKEVAFEEIQTQQLVEKELWKTKRTIEVFSTSTLYHALDLPFALKDIPDIFTNFRKRVEKESTIRNVFNKPKSINSPKIEELKIPRLEQLGLSKFKTEKRQAINFVGGETEALKRLDDYFYKTKSINNYKNSRNEMIGENYSTKFSAWLSLGCLSPREIYFELKKYESLFSSNESTYWLEFELLWRDYFRFMMKKHKNKYFLEFGIKENEESINKHNENIFGNWKNGTTGNNFIDANMIELNLTGYMSNRGRQNVASFLCNDLNLDWRYGAAYFEQQLIDYDVCSNWGNWVYLAGVGNDPRGKRIFNIEKQANDYDKLKTYQKLWLNKI